MTDLVLRLAANSSKFVTPTGEIRLGEVAQWLNLRPAEFAEATGQRTESVARNFGKESVLFRHDGARRVANELVELVGLLSDFGYSPETAQSWFRTPSPTFGGRNPLQVIQNQQGRTLIDMLLAIAMGGAGMSPSPMPMTAEEMPLAAAPAGTSHA
ncbi:MAG: MbcA/ParS/Xre antitoxin family protein [Myxococcota bacterium]